MGLLLLLLLFSCKPQLPEGVLSEGKMERVLYDYHIAQVIAESDAYSDQPLDVRRYELQQAVLRKHGITQAEFDSSMVFYCSDIPRLNAIYNRVAQRFEREAEALGAVLDAADLYARLTADGDTANVWVGRKVFAVRNRLGENLHAWRIACDSTWLEGDDLLWRFQTQTFSREGYYQSIYALLVITYTNDSVRARTVQLNDRASGELRIDNPEGWVPSTVAGQLFLPVEEDPQRSRLYIVNHPSLIRFHKSPEWRARLHATDTLATDTLVADTLAADTLADRHSSRSDKSDADAPQHRRTPTEFREQQSVDKKIEIVKEKPYQIRRGKNTKRRQQGSRR
ncbi:MAG: DUF4296 domain-containing protein [Bacteroidaceae bacterium]|nr:DUF4296 domain-containing protein [Bacteroidaceae bacterium]